MAYRRRGTKSEIADEVDSVAEEDQRKDSEVRGAKEVYDEAEIPKVKTGDVKENKSAISDTGMTNENCRKTHESCCIIDDSTKKTFCCCEAKGTSRFSMLVMEALRSLQRNGDAFPTSGIEEIVGYVERNYQTDGDVYAQSLTALKQVCSQGFVMEVLKNEYHLIGPVAKSINETSADKDDHIPTAKSPESSSQSGSCNKNCARRSGHNLSRTKRSFTNAAKNSINKSTKSDDRDEDLSIDEEVEGIEDNCACAGKKRRNGRKLSNPTGKHGRRASESFRRNQSGKNRDRSQQNRIPHGSRVAGKVSSTEESEDTDDQEFRDLLTSTPKRQNAKRAEELAEWIKHCQEECKRRGRSQRRM